MLQAHAVEALTHERDKALALKPPHLPEFFVRDFFDGARPGFPVVKNLSPMRADAPLEEVAQKRRDPSRRVYAVRHGSYRHLVNVALRPHLIPKLARHLSVLAAHAVRRAAHAKRERR